MTSMAVAEPVTVPETRPEQLPAVSGLPPEEPPAAARHDKLPPLAIAQCSLCGITRPLGLLVPDGGQACADIRWYCKDAKSCTERWTTARTPVPANPQPVPGTAVADAGDTAPDAAPAGRAARRKRHSPPGKTSRRADHRPDHDPASCAGSATGRDAS